MFFMYFKVISYFCCCIYKFLKLNTSTLKMDADVLEDFVGPN